MSLLLKWLAVASFVLVFLVPCYISISAFPILLDDNNVTSLGASIYLAAFVGLPILGLIVTVMAFALAKGLDLLVEMEDSINHVKYMMQHEANVPDALPQSEKPSDL